MRRRLERAERWFQTPTELADFALFQWLFCSVLAVQILLHFGEQLDFLLRRAPFDAALDLPVPYLQHAPLLGVVEVPELGPLGFCIAGIVLVAGLVGGAVGWRGRAFLPVALLAYFLYFGQILELGTVRRKTNVVPFLLLILAMSPALGPHAPRVVREGIRRPWAASTPAWPLVLAKLFLASTYLGAGLSKLRNTGWSWARGEVLQANLLEHAIASDLAPALWLAAQPELCRIASVGTLVFELGFWTVLLFPRYGPLYALAGLAFHTGIRVFMGIPYLQYWALAYLVFVDAAALRWCLHRAQAIRRATLRAAGRSVGPG